MNITISFLLCRSLLTFAQFALKYIMCLPSAHSERISYFTINIFLVFSTYNPELLESDRTRELSIDFSGAVPFTKAEHQSSG